MRIESVTICNMHNVDNKTYRFNDDVNYLFGPNGSGKSTVLNAIQLAILGYIPGTPKQIAQIFKHSKAPTMSVKVNFDDGSYIERTWKQKGKSIDCKTDTNLTDLDLLVSDLELPVFNFSELMSMTANKLKDWFIGFLPSASSKINWKKELEDSIDGMKIMDPNLISKTLNQIHDYEKSSESTLEVIQKMNQYLKDDQSFLKKELQRSDATIQSLVYYDEDGLTGSEDYLNNEILAARNKIQSLTAEKERMIVAMQTVQTNKNIQNQIASLPEQNEDEINKMKSDAESIPAEIVDINGKISELENNINEEIAKISEYKSDIKSKMSIINGEGICPYTSKSCDSILAIIDGFKIQVASLSDNQKNAEDNLSKMKNELQKLKTLLLEKQNSLSILNRKIQEAQNNKTRKSQLESMITDSPDISNFKEPNWYSESIFAENERISKIQSNMKYSSLIDKLTREKYQMENTIEVYKLWVKLTDPNGLQTKIMDEPFKNFENEMTEYLTTMFSESVECKFDLQQKANSFSFGIKRNGDYISYDLLSSGEKTMYTIALLLCIINKSKSNLKLLIVDDMLDHLDDRRADEVFDSIKNIQDIQIISAGVKKSDNASSYTINVI